MEFNYTQQGLSILIGMFIKTFKHLKDAPCTVNSSHKLLCLPEDVLYKSDNI